MADSENHEPREAVRFNWQSHVGLIVGAATATLVCIKILAVANWDMNTALGVLAANGTANVLTGSLLAVLPVLAAVFAVGVAPMIEQNLSRRTPVERAAVRLAEVWPGLLLIFIAPTILLFLVVLWWIVIAVVRLRRKGKKRNRATKDSKAGGAPPSRFESLSVGLASVFILVFSSLMTPWLPSEVVSLEGEETTAYVLNVDQNRATVLFAGDRSLAQVDANAVSGQYCARSGSWLNSPFILVFKDERYPNCPG